MHVLQKAAEDWENHHTEVLKIMGFKSGIASPCVFKHPERGMSLVVYGDVFSARGAKGELDQYKDQMVQIFQMTIKARIGHVPHDDKKARILNRILRVTQEGAEYEASRGTLTSSVG